MFILKIILIVIFSSFIFFESKFVYAIQNCSPKYANNVDEPIKWKWHNCFGELYQNYNNKKKWITIFKDGLPNGYGTVKYDNSDGYYEGFFLNGKISSPLLTKIGLPKNFSSFS